MGILNLFRRGRGAIADPGRLAAFLDRNAAFLVQKGIYEYSRARSGLAFEKLFREADFIAAVEVARWRAFPIGLRLVGEMVEAQLRPHAAGAEADLLDFVHQLCLGIFDGYARPETISAAEWAQARGDLSERLRRLQLAEPKLVKDIPIQDGRTFFALMPIHETLTTTDYALVRNNLRVNLCRIYEDFLAQADLPALAEHARTRAAPRLRP